MLAGSHFARPLFPPVRVLSRVFRGTFVAALETAFRNGTLEFHGQFATLAEPRVFSFWLRLLFRKTGSSIPSRPSVVRNTCCAISVPTHIESPSPTTECLPSLKTTLDSAGEIPLTTIRSGL